MIFNLLKRFRYRVLALVIIGIAASLLEAVSITLFIPILESIQKQNVSLPFPLNKISLFFTGFDFGEKLRIVAIILLLLTVIKGIVLFINGILAARLEANITNYQQMLCFKNLFNSEMGYFNSQKASHLYTIIIPYAGQFGNISKAIADMGPSIFTLVVLLGMLILISWKMTLIACLLTFVSSIALQKLQHSAVEAGEAIKEVNKMLNSTVFDAIAGMKTIRLFNRVQDMIQRFQENQNNWAVRVIKVLKVQAASGPVFEIISTAGLSLLLIIGSFIFFQRGNPIFKFDYMLAFLLIFSRLFPPISAINKTRINISAAIPMLRESERFLKESGERSIKDGSRIFYGIQRGIEFKNVTFNYREEGSVVLKNVCFYIHKGTKVGIAGYSGSGKSTIAELIMGFYTPQSGQIFIDGINLRDLKLESWRRYIGVVAQDTFLFNDTVRNNIAYAKPDATQEEIEKAANCAHAHGFILDLPNGYDTFIGDRGVLLSGGQRQRIAIARAVLNDPQILIFDEATSSLDTESEQIVQKALNEVGQGRTVITIAHRLSTISDSNRILVIDDGRIVQEGTHEELLRQAESLYARLVQMQSLEPLANKDKGFLVKEEIR